MKKSILLFFICCCYNLVTNAQEQLTFLKTTHISIFKNGTYFITREGEARPQNGMFAIAPPSNILNGTFWLAAGKENKITSISVKPDTIKVSKQIQTTAEFISSCIGKNIVILLPPAAENGTVREIKGKVLNYFALTKTVKIKTTDGKVMMCNTADALEVYNDGSDADTYQQDSLVRMARIQLEHPADKINVSTVALQTGMSWVPSYFLKLTDDKNAKLELKATVGNNSEEKIVNAAVDLVIGNPQLFYGTQLDDISTDYLQNRLIDYEKYATQNTFQLSNMYTNSSSGAMNNFVEQTKMRTQIPVERATYNTDGEKTNDLYYFNLGNLNIDAYSKTIVPILTTDLTYKDLYELDVLDYNNYWSNRSIRNDPSTVLSAYHVIKIENTSKAPFTTGPIFITDQKDKPLAQDQMTYTAKGATVRIQLSQAIDIQAKNNEEVLFAEVAKRKIDDHTYTVALLKGKLTVYNYQAKAIKMNISKWLNGKVTQSDDGKVEATAQYYEDGRNLSSVIKWEKEIAANGKLVLTYQYEVLLY